MGTLQKVREEDIAPNVKKLIVCLLIDSSLSMLGKKINSANDGIKTFLRSTSENEDARDMVDVCIISYGEGVKIIQPFSNVTQIHFNDIIPSGETPMNDGLKTALHAIKERQKHWENIGTEILKPWLFILSDGESDQNVDDTAKQIKELCLTNQLKIKCIAIGENGGTRTLRKLTPDKKVLEINEMEISHFFDLVSRKVAGQSVAAVDVDGYDIQVENNDK